MDWNSKEDIKEYNKKYYLQNKEKIDNQIREYSLLHKKELKEYRKKYHNTLIGKYKQYQKRADKRGIDFTLTIDEFATMYQEQCFYCGERLEAIGVDRIDSNLGYVKGNCVPCCTKCNCAKSTMLPMDFVKHCEKIINNFGLKNKSLLGGN